MPAGQPATAAIAQGLDAIYSMGDADNWRDRYNQARRLYEGVTSLEIRKAKKDWNENWQQFRMSEIKDLKSWKERGKTFADFADTMMPMAKEILKQRELWRSVQVAPSEIQQKIENIKTFDSEFNEAVMALEQLHKRKSSLQTKASKFLQEMEQLQADLLRDLNLFSDLASNYLDTLITLNKSQIFAIDRIAERGFSKLWQFIHDFKRAYYYRTLSAYPHEIDFQDLFISIDRLINDQATPPSRTNYNDLKILFRSKIDKIVRNVVNHDDLLSRQRETSRSFKIPTHQLRALSEGRSFYINLADFNIFSNQFNDIRIKNISIRSVRLDYDQDISGPDDYATLGIIHGGHSIFSLNNKKYYFNHYAPQEVTPFFWGKSISLSNTNLSAPIRVSDTRSLLAAVLRDGNHRDSFYDLFIRPSALTDLKVYLDYNGNYDSIDLKEVEVQVDFSYSL